MTHLYDSYLFESGWSGDAATAREGRVDYPAEIRPQRMPGLPHATTKQTLNIGAARGAIARASFFLFFSITHGTNGGEISLFFCSATSTASILLPFFYFIDRRTCCRGVTDHFVPKSGNILADFSRYSILLVTNRMFTEFFLSCKNYNVVPKKSSAMNGTICIVSSNFRKWTNEIAIFAGRRKVKVS